MALKQDTKTLSLKIWNKTCNIRKSETILENYHRPDKWCPITLICFSGGTNYLWKLTSEGEREKVLKHRTIWKPIGITLTFFARTKGRLRVRIC